MTDRITPPRFAFLLALLIGGGVHAADSATSLPTVVVIGATPLPGVELVPDQIAAPVRVFTAEDFERSHVLDLSGQLNRALGSVHVNETQGNPLQADLNYRGFTASPLLGTAQGISVYVDGMRINQPFGDVVSWDLIPKAAIATATLMPGSNPVFGLNTLGGALAVTTKDGRRNPGTALEAVVGEHGRTTLGFEHGGQGANGLDVYVAANAFDDDGWRERSPSEVRQLFGKLGWADARTELSLSLALADNRLTGNGLQQAALLARDWRSVYTLPDITANRAVSLNLAGRHRIAEEIVASGNVYWRSIRASTYNGDLNDDALDQSIYQPGGDERDALAAAGYGGFPSSGANAANTPFPFWRCLGNVLLGDEPAEKCNGLINRTRTDQVQYGAAAQVALVAGQGDVRHRFAFGAGFDASRITFRQGSQFGYINPDRGVTPVDFFADGSALDEDGLPIDSRVDLAGRTRTWSIHATDTMSWSGGWNFTLSGRYNHTDIRNRDRLVPGGGPGSLDGHHRYGRFNPALGLTWSPTAAFGAYVGYGEGSRTPTAVELGCADPANPCKLPNAMAGDPPLQQVVTGTWEAGLRGMTAGGLRWSAGVFRADNRDDILFVADNAAGFGYFRNFGRTRRQGIELGLDSAGETWRWGGHLTFLDATFRSAEIVNGAANSSNDATQAGLPGQEGNIAIRSGDHIPLIPRAILKLYAEWQATPTFTLAADMSAVAGSYARGNENNRHRPDGTYYLDGGKSPGYAVIGLGADWQVSRAFRWFARVDNLFDTRYVTGAQLGATGFGPDGGFVARPFPVAANGEWPLQNASFRAPGVPRMVSVGVRYRFE